MDSKEKTTLVCALCGFFIVLVGVFVMILGDKNVVLPSSIFTGGIVACFGFTFTVGQLVRVLFYRLEKLEKIVEIWEDTKDERTEDP